ncbi:hypothetical protein EDEG_03216 [Edhazardia aedis USNM 41457]|uniref:Uncharacterized protein n=1 Tax=Edhazardia aedis (strain USNM 41457) TaxID=1003232 RepID=J9DLU7_EDHAE|nr:hypothetical protein EDEG_03216 [Edhazardia aedis USNM 41457]|eukprot:EJW02357.1 hypothetical protein EDEG_03216 [Edhazardia aedis USNM 41457]
MKNKNPNDYLNFIKYNSPRRYPGYNYSQYLDSKQWLSTQRSHPPNKPCILPNSKSCGQTDGHRHIISRSKEVSPSMHTSSMALDTGHWTYDRYIYIFFSI